MDDVNKIARKEYFEKYIEIWKKDLEDYKNNKDLIINKYINDETMFKYIPSSQRNQVIKEHVEILISKYEEKIKMIEQEISQN